MTTPLPSNAFASVLAQHANGQTSQELSDAMRECILAVKDTGMPGVLTLKVKFIKIKSGAILLEPEVTAKPPKSDTPQSIWFPDAEGNLHREDPRQLELKPQPVRTVEEPAQEARKAE